MNHFAPRRLRLESKIFRAWSLWVCTAHIAASAGIVVAAGITLLFRAFQ